MKSSDMIEKVTSYRRDNKFQDIIDLLSNYKPVSVDETLSYYDELIIAFWYTNQKERGHKLCQELSTYLLNNEEAKTSVISILSRLKSNVSFYGSYDSWYKNSKIVSIIYPPNGVFSFKGPLYSTILNYCDKGYRVIIYGFPRITLFSLPSSNPYFCTDDVKLSHIYNNSDILLANNISKNKNIIKISFVDFWPTLLTCQTDKPLIKFLYSLLPDSEIIIVEPNNADIVFCSVFGKEKYKYSHMNLILFQGENEKLGYDAPYDMMKCTMTHHRETTLGSCRNFTVPFFLIYHNMTDLLVKRPYIKKDKFCCFIVSNGKATQRIDFFNYLSKYKKIDSGGKVLNNIGYLIGGSHSSNELIEFISQYKFCICFENSSAPGYCTEKIIQSMKAGTIPIYWGDPLISDYFNMKSFVVVNDFESAYNQIMELDTNDEKYISMYNEHWFNNNTIPTFLNLSQISNDIKSFIKDIVQ